MNELINKDNEWIIHFMGSLDRLLDSFEHLTANYRPTLGKSSVRCPLKPSDSIPLCPNNPAH